MKSNVKILAQNLQSKSLLILGGTGLFAKTLLPKLINYIEVLNVNTKIYLTTRNKKKAIQFIPEINKTYIEILTIDFLSEDVIKEKLSPDFIIHMATTSAFETYSQISQFSKFLVLQNSVKAIEKIIKKSNVKKLLFVSSGVAYGAVSLYEENINTNINVLDSKNSLAIGKVYSEYFLNSICNMYNIEFKIARCFSFISEYLPCDIHYAIGNFVRDATFDKEIIINSDGKDLRSFQDLSDTVEWLTFILNERLPYKIINVGSDEAISILNLARKVKKVINAKSQIIVRNNIRQIDNSRRNKYIPSLNRAYSLGLRQNITLDESIINLSNNLKRNK